MLVIAAHRSTTFPDFRPANDFCFWTLLPISNSGRDDLPMILSRTAPSSLVPIGWLGYYRFGSLSSECALPMADSLGPLPSKRGSHFGVPSGSQNPELCPGWVAIRLVSGREQWVYTN